MTLPSVFGLPHLSEDAVAAFADGVLSPPAAARARRHCAECFECREAVRGQREAAMMLRTASAPALPAGLLDRLAGLPMSAPLPDRRGGLPTALDPDGVPMFVAHQPSHLQTHQVRDVADRPGAEQHGAQESRANDPAERTGHRRVLFPVSMIASAAAVVAAGTLGGTASSFQPTLEQPASVNLAPNLVAGSTQSGTGRAAVNRPASSDLADDYQATAGLDSMSSWLVSQAVVIRPMASRPHPAP